MQPPTLVAVNSKNSLKLPSKADSKYKRLIKNCSSLIVIVFFALRESSVAVKKPVAPGKVFHWD